MLWLRTTTSTGNSPLAGCGCPAEHTAADARASRVQLPDRSGTGPARTGRPGRREGDHCPRATGPQGNGGSRERRARGGDVVDDQHRRRHRPPRCEHRAGEPRHPVEAGLRRPGAPGQQTATTTAQPAGDRTREQLGVVEATIAMPGRGRRRPRHDRRQRWLERRDHRVGHPPDGCMDTPVLHPGDHLARDSGIRERRRPPVDARWRCAHGGRTEDGRADRTHRTATTAPGAHDGQERGQHPPNVRAAYDIRATTPRLRHRGPLPSSGKRTGSGTDQ